MEAKSISEIALTKPILLLKLDRDEQDRLGERLYDSTRINIAIKYSNVRELKLPCIALILSEGGFGASSTFVGVLSKKSPATTFESRITIDHIREINGYELSDLIGLVTDKRLRGLLVQKLEELGRAVKLSPKLSSLLIEGLCRSKKNKTTLNSLRKYLLDNRKKHFSANAALQEDAVKTALKIFGIKPTTIADLCDTTESGDTALSDIRVREDSIIEHDARVVDDMQLQESNITGTAIFRDRQRVLEVVTANKRPLEEVLGVDLIYINRTMCNVVLVQYKMLERKGRGMESRWIYRPDMQLQKELKRMRSVLIKRSAPSPSSFRLNDQPFYIKLVKRELLESAPSITLPLDQFELELSNPDNRGPNGGVIIDYQSLGGRYLRSAPFIELLKDGCIGTHDAELPAWSALIDLLITGNRSVVVALQTDIDSPRELKVPASDDSE